MNPLQLFVIGWLAVALIMTITFQFAWTRGNAGIVDVVWTYAIGLLALFYTFANNIDFNWRQAATLSLVLFWSLRLGTYLWLRVANEEEDGRYQSLKQKWKGNLKRKLFFFFQMQAVADSFLSIAILVAIFNPTPFGALTDYIGISIALIAIIGEGIADNQLQRFRSQSDNAGKTCRDGLWRYSRHPNYFFEWLYWWSFPLLALGSAAWPLALLSPLALLYLILKVTGIPPTEEQALLKRGDDYRTYQNETNAFFPWFRKRT
jgi:steroid 5-alpha reductase family enzyme